MSYFSSLLVSVIASTMAMDADYCTDSFSGKAQASIIFDNLVKSGTEGGACGNTYDLFASPSEKDYNVVALSYPKMLLGNGGNVCDSCIEVTESSFGNKQILKVFDTVNLAVADDMVIPQEIFDRLKNPSDSNPGSFLDISWKFVPCSETKKIQHQFRAGMTHVSFLKLITPLVKLEVRNNLGISYVLDHENTFSSYYRLPQDSQSAPLTFTLTSITGETRTIRVSDNTETLTDTNVQFSPGCTVNSNNDENNGDENNDDANDSPNDGNDAVVNEDGNDNVSSSLIPSLALILSTIFAFL